MKKKVQRLQRLRKVLYGEKWIEAATNATDPEKLHGIIEQSSEEVAVAALRNPICSPKSLDFLAKSHVHTHRVKLMVPKHHNVTEETLEYLLLIKHSEEWRAAVAQSPKLPRKWWERLLVIYKNGDVPYYLSQNPAATEEDLDRLSRINDVHIMANILKHPNTSAETRERVREELEEELQKESGDFIEAIKNMSLDERRRLARKTEDPRKLKILAEDDDEKVCEFAGSNEATSLKTLEKLSKHWSYRVKRRVAVNPRMTQQKLINMLKDERNASVICTIARNPRLVEESYEGFELLLKKRRADILCAMIENPEITSEYLEKLSKRNNIMIKCFVARHVKTSKAVRDELLEDEDEMVRFEVKCYYEKHPEEK